MNGVLFFWVVTTLFLPIFSEAGELRSVAHWAPHPSSEISKTLTQEQCGDIDLSNDPRFPPVRNQGGSKYCTAYAMADVIGFRERQHISALDLAYQTRFRQQGRKSEGFTAYGAIWPDEISEFVNHGGYCLEKHAKSSFENNQHSEIMSALQALPDPHQTKDLQASLFGRGYTRKINTEADLRQRIQISCGARRRLKKPVSFDFADPAHHSAAELFSSLNNRQPSLIHLDGSKLWGVDSSHMAVVVGRRWNGKSCDIIVRDSSGPNCGFFASNGYKCVNGNVHIPSSVLIEATFRTARLVDVDRIKPELMGPAARGRN